MVPTLVRSAPKYGRVPLPRRSQWSPRHTTHVAPYAQAIKDDMIEKGFSDLVEDSDSDTDIDGTQGGGAAAAGGGGGAGEAALGGHYPMMVLRRGTIMKLDSLPSHEEAKRRCALG